jgi:hypothetical protein
VARLPCTRVHGARRVPVFTLTEIGRSPKNSRPLWLRSPRTAAWRRWPRIGLENTRSRGLLAKHAVRRLKKGGSLTFTSGIDKYPVRIVDFG